MKTQSTYPNYTLPAMTDVLRLLVQASGVGEAPNLTA